MKCVRSDLQVRCKGLGVPCLNILAQQMWGIKNLFQLGWAGRSRRHRSPGAGVPFSLLEGKRQFWSEKSASPPCAFHGRCIWRAGCSLKTGFTLSLGMHELCQRTGLRTILLPSGEMKVLALSLTPVNLGPLSKSPINLQGLDIIT